jgi:hypothetical protein
MDTWASNDLSDLSKFYKFIKALKRYSRSNYRHRIKSIIVSAVRSEHPSLSNEHINKMASEYTSIANHILDYEESPFPDHLLEMRNPHVVYLILGSIQKRDRHGELVPFYNERQINDILESNFGLDWRHYKSPFSHKSI